LDNKNASTSNEKVGAVINILDFGVFEGLALKAKKPEADPKLDQPSGYSMEKRGRDISLYYYYAEISKNSAAYSF